jgi:RimJ/RimL family protein N-acetyltransferase
LSKSNGGSVTSSAVSLRSSSPRLKIRARSAVPSPPFFWPGQATGGFATRVEGAGMAPQIETERLILRPWRDADVEAWIAMNSRPRVMEFFPGVDARADLEASAERLRARLERDGYGWWIVEVRESGAFAGILALSDVPADLPVSPALEIGWRFVPEVWGNGYATEGARSLLEFAFTQLDKGEVVALTAAINRRSQRVMERLGMRRDPHDDFDHPRLTEGHRLRPHVLYRIARSTSA